MEGWGGGSGGGWRDGEEGLEVSGARPLSPIHVE